MFCAARQANNIVVSPISNTENDHDEEPPAGLMKQAQTMQGHNMKKAQDALALSAEGQSGTAWSRPRDVQERRRCVTIDPSLLTDDK
jgi:DNA-binding protein YbaB